MFWERMASYLYKSQLSSLNHDIIRIEYTSNIKNQQKGGANQMTSFNWLLRFTEQTFVLSNFEYGLSFTQEPDDENSTERPHFIYHKRNFNRNKLNSEVHPSKP